MIALISSILFILGYALITLEYKWDIKKSVTAILLGGVLWLLIAFGVHSRAEVAHALEGIGSEIFGLIIFLMSAMVLVETLVHYRFFDLVRAQLIKLKLDDRGQLWVIAIISFFLSAVIDNMTTAIVMTQISRRFFKGGNLIAAAAVIIIAANAGGAFSPIGDVTTIMLWLAGKFTALQVIREGFFPALALMLVSVFMLARRVAGDKGDVEEEAIVLKRSEIIVIAMTLCSFILPVVANQIGLPPYFGLLMAVGVVYGVISLFKFLHGHETHLTADIEHILRKVDVNSLLFFVGILLAVGALRFLGVLNLASVSIFGQNPEVWRLVLGSSLLGLLSAIVDNIPLTAAAINILHSSSHSIWVLFALAVGTGGSILIVGSAAGVVVMGMVKEMTFFKYMKTASIPALTGYVVGIAVWGLQYMTSVLFVGLLFSGLIIVFLIKKLFFSFLKPARVAR